MLVRSNREERFILYFLIAKAIATNFCKIALRDRYQLF